MASTKDIKDFTKYPSLSDNDIILGTKTDLGGSDAGITVSAFRKQVGQDVKPIIKNGYWWVDGINTGQLAVGKTPVFRKTSAGLEMKYEGEDDAAYVLLIPMADLAFAFDDLSPEQIEKMKLKFSDLTEADKEALRGEAFTYDMFTPAQLADLRLTWDKLTPDQKNSLKGERGYSAFEVWTQREGNSGKTEEDYFAWLQKPATDAAARVDEKMVQISEDVSQKISELNSTNESVQDAEDLRDTAETQRKAAEQARLTAETNRDVEEGKRVISEKKRATDEEARNTEELERIESEKNRIEEEKKRVLTETGRTEAENKRQMDTTEAVDRLDSLSDHRDEIRDGYWWHWNETTKEYEKTENRADGNTLFASFELDPLTGELSVTTPDGYDGPTFELDNRGYLSVIV